MSYYFIYNISQGPGSVVKTLQKIERYDAYQEAKKKVRELRSEQTSVDQSQFKIIFAENELQAEESLQETREAPIVQEWEK